MRHIFLSASIPYADRDERYYSTMDIVAIRDAVRALATVVLPEATLYWGGHPAITPLIRAVAESMDFTGVDRIRLFQSAWFERELPADNAVFERVEMTPRRETREASLKLMREVMLAAATFDSGVFIGGMEGVETEFEMFRSTHPDANVLPIASTGAAAAILFYRERHNLHLSTDLAHEYAFPSLFRKLLNLPTQTKEG